MCAIANIDINGDNVNEIRTQVISAEIHDHEDYTSNEPGAVTAAPNSATKGATMTIYIRCINK